MIVLTYAGDIPFPSYANKQAVDVLMVDEQGTITRIYPSITLNTINDDLHGKGATKAFLLLLAGSVDQHAIRPGDKVEHPTFAPPPRVLE